MVNSYSDKDLKSKYLRILAFNGLKNVDPADTWLSLHIKDHVMTLKISMGFL